MRILELWIIDLNEELDFPFPSKLKFYQWRQLLCYDHHFAMTFYLISILRGTDKDKDMLEALRKLDETTATSLRMPRGSYDDFIGKNSYILEANHS